MTGMKTKLLYGTELHYTTAGGREVELDVEYRTDGTIVLFSWPDQGRSGWPIRAEFNPDGVVATRTWDDGAKKTRRPDVVALARGIFHTRGPIEPLLDELMDIDPRFTDWIVCFLEGRA